MCLTVPLGGATQRIPENLSNLQKCIMPCVQDACACSAPRPEEAIPISPSTPGPPVDPAHHQPHGGGGEGHPTSEQILNL